MKLLFFQILWLKIWSHFMLSKWKYLEIEAFPDNSFIAKFNQHWISNQMIYSLLRFSEKKFSKKVLTPSTTWVSDGLHQNFASPQIKEHLYQVLCLYTNLEHFSASSPHYIMQKRGENRSEYKITLCHISK